MRRENHVQRSRMSKMGLTDGAQSGPRVGDMVQPLGHKVVQVFAPKKDGKKMSPTGSPKTKMETKMSPKGSREAKDAKTRNFYQIKDEP